METLLQDATARALRYLQQLGDRTVAPAPEAVERLQELDFCLPDEPTDANAVLRLLDEVGSPATVATAGPRFYGFVIGGALPVTLAANWLASAWDQNAGLWAATPIAAALEE
ncbi:MAG: aspartate aminotransferase family protein, partial [Calditrichaeota bacterium]